MTVIKVPSFMEQGFKVADNSIKFPDGGRLPAWWRHVLKPTRRALQHPVDGHTEIHPLAKPFRQTRLRGSAFVYRRLFVGLVPGVGHGWQFLLGGQHRLENNRPPVQRARAP